MKFERTKVINKVHIMKKIFIIAVSFFLFSAFQPAPVKSNQSRNVEIPQDQKKYGPEISFEKTVHQFGEIEQGVPVKTFFKFKNTGNSPLFLLDVKAGCGCTTPIFSKEPIMPGESASIEVGYDAKNMGLFNKDITVTSNAGETKLLIKGTVIKTATDQDKTPEIKF
jgi:hypothetical protein